VVVKWPSMNRTTDLNLVTVQNVWTYLSTPCIRLHVLLPSHIGDLNLAYFMLPIIAVVDLKKLYRPISVVFQCVLHAPLITYLD